MNLARHHPIVEAAGGGLLTGLGTAINFADQWLTPVFSFGAAAIGFFFAVHGLFRFLQRRHDKKRRREDDKR